MEDTMKRISDVLSDDPSALFQTDALGMTPLHILALAQKPVAELLRRLLSGLDVAVLKYVSKNP